MRVRATDQYIIKVIEMSGSDSSVPGNLAFRKEPSRTLICGREKQIMSMLCACRPGRIHNYEFGIVI